MYFSSRLDTLSSDRRWLSMKNHPILHDHHHTEHFERLIQTLQQSLKHPLRRVACAQQDSFPRIQAIIKFLCV
jgi:hypothetical protein